MIVKTNICYCPNRINRLVFPLEIGYSVTRVNKNKARSGKVANFMARRL